MKKLYMNSSRGIIALLAVCLLLGIAGIGARATAIAEEITVVTEKTTQELAPARAKNCPTYIPGIGWTGSQDWNNAIARVQAGGHIEGWGVVGLFE